MYIFQEKSPYLLVRAFTMVEVTGLEPAASWSQTKHSTKLSYASITLFLLFFIQTALLLYTFLLKMSIKKSIFVINYNYFLLSSSDYRHYALLSHVRKYIIIR